MDHVTYVQGPAEDHRLGWYCRGCRGGAGGIPTARGAIAAALAHGPLAVDSPVPVDALRDGGLPTLTDANTLRAALAHAAPEPLGKRIRATLDSLPPGVRAQLPWLSPNGHPG